MLAQAASQGQTVIAAAGDDGSTDCYGETTLTTAQQTALAVDFPGSSQYVTSVGGTEFPAADVAAGNSTYWTAASGTTDTIDSAVSYIPEGVWNDDSSAYPKDPLSSGGGGVSAYTPQPTWQTNVPGIPAGSNRMVPDIALDASPNNAGYLVLLERYDGLEHGPGGELQQRIPRFEHAGPDGGGRNQLCGSDLRGHDGGDQSESETRPDRA